MVFFRQRLYESLILIALPPPQPEIAMRDPEMEPGPVEEFRQRH